MWKIKSAVMQKVLVFDKSLTQVGTGYIFHYANGRTSPLFDNQGKELGPGEYMITPTGEENLVIVTRTIQ